MTIFKKTHTTLELLKKYIFITLILFLKVVQGDCRIPQDSCIRGECVVVVDNTTASCDCTGTEFTGIRCEISLEDCLTIGCLNQGICDSETRTCECLGNFEGALCEIELISCTRENFCKNGASCEDIGVNEVNCTCSSWRFRGPTCSIDLVPFIILIIAFLLTFVVCFILRSYYPDADNLILLSLFLSLYDFLTDCLFANSRKDDESKRLLFILSLVFIVVPVAFHFLSLLYIILSSASGNQKIKEWISKHYVIVFAVILVASTDTEVFALLYSRLFYRDFFNAPFTKRTLHLVALGGFFGSLLEDIPQLTIQLISAKEELDTITLLSLIASIFTIIIGLLKNAFVFFIMRWDELLFKKKVNESSEMINT